MAYGLLLYKEIEAPEGLHRLEVWKDGYAGDAIEIDGLVRDSINISKNAGDACDAITTSVLTFALYDTGQLDYSQFFTPNAVLFKVVWKMNGSARWTGYLTPDSYSENLSYRDVITLTARDNLGRLNDYDFTLARGQMMTVRSLIVQGLTVAGVAMDTVFVTTKVASSPDTTLAIDGLVNTSLLVGSTWHEALTLLLEGLGLTLSWNDGNKFEVRDITQAPSASQSAFFISKSGFRQIRPAWKNVTVSQNYVLQEDFYDGAFSKDDCGGTGREHKTFTPPTGSHWAAEGSMVLMNPYNGTSDQAVTLFPRLGTDDTLTDALVYSRDVPAMERTITISMKLNNTLWYNFDTERRFGISFNGYTHQSATRVDGYTVCFRFNVFLTYGGTKYVLRENWEVYDPQTIEQPYLYFNMPWTREGVNQYEEASISIASIPADGVLEFVVYRPLAYLFNGTAENSQPINPDTNYDWYGRINDIAMTIGEGVTGRDYQILINPAHNIQSGVEVSLGQVPPLRGNALLYFGGLFYDNAAYTPLSDFARANGGETSDLLEIISREHIAFNNSNYDLLSGTMKADAAFRFDRAITFEGTQYRIIAASLAVLSNTLSVQMMQTEPTYPTDEYQITEVDSEGGSSRVSGGTGGASQGASSDASQENILVLTEGLAKAYARITSLEDWLRDPAFDELPLDTLNVARCINLGGMAMEYDADNGAWHLLGNFYADGWVSAGGVNSEGGGGGGGIDLGAMWTSLRNTPTQTSEVTADTKIALAHLPYTAGAGVSISNAGAISIAESGIEPGTYTKVTVDAYGRVTNAENPTTLAGYGITDGASAAEVATLSAAVAALEAGVAAYSDGIANVFARVSSLEDWLRNPWLDELNATALNAQTVDVGTLLTVDGAANIAGLLTASGELKVTGSSKKIWLGDNVYLELDTNGYIHTNGAFYSDSFISAGGLGTGGGGTGGLDLGAMWTSLCNTTVPTSAVNANTKIAVAHIPDITTAKISDLSTWWTTQRASLNLGAAASKGIGTVTDGNTDLVTGDSVYDFVMAALDTEALENNIAEGLANLAARAASLEDWLRDPALDTLQVADLCAATATVTRIYIGDAYFEYDADGYLHTNAPLYSDEWISAGGVEAGGGSGSVDLGAVWTSLCNEPIATADITPTTKIALSHIPISAGDGIAISNAGAVSLALSGVAAGTYAAVTVDAYGRVTSGSAPAALTFGSKSYDGTQAVTLTAADLGALTSTYALTINNSGGTAVLTYNPATAAASLTLTKAMVGLGNVENTKLSTWAGSANLTTLGTITSGTWHGSAIGNSYLENSAITLAGTSVSLGGSLTAAQLRSLLSINNVENVALSTWRGSTYINTVGTITTGTWQGSRISNSYLVHSTITLAGRTISLGGSASKNEIRYDLGIDNVENTALSTWAGSGNITTVGTITTGVWHGTAIANANLANSTIKIAGRTIALGGTVTKNELLYDLGLSTLQDTLADLQDDVSALQGNVSTLQSNVSTLQGNAQELYGLTGTLFSYFTNGVAKEAERLTTVSKTAWGQTYWTSDGVPTNISGTMNGVTAIDDTMYFTAGSGKVGIGVISPSETLDVGGTFRVSGNAYLNSLVVIGGGSAYLEAAGSYLHTHVGFAADGFVSAGGVSSSSDARLKKNLKDIALTVHDIAAAPAVSFDWVDDRGSSAGSIAQYWKPLLPDNVRAWEVDGFLSMEYGNIALLAAITIARAVETQEQKIARLEARVQELENQLLN